MSELVEVKEKIMKLKAGELSLNVVEMGAGEPELLFLHYWGGSARTWKTVMASLADFRCIAYCPWPSFIPVDTE